MICKERKLIKAIINSDDHLPSMRYFKDNNVNNSRYCFKTYKKEYLEIILERIESVGITGWVLFKCRASIYSSLEWGIKKYEKYV